jgi:BASS family bile acid:Na+ symporter
MGKLGTVGLPAAVFSPWMNISGSILANYWRKQADKQAAVPESETKK